MIDLDRIIEDNRAEGDTPIRQAQLVMLRNLRIVDNICRRHKLKYWLCSGTLLGAVRHQGFIPWDDDIDISMLRADYERFLSIADKELPDSVMLDLRKASTASRYNILPCKLRDLNSIIIEPGNNLEDSEQGIFLDIFPFDWFSPNRSFRFKYESFLKSAYILIVKLKESVFYKEDSAVRRVLSYFNFLWLMLFRWNLKLGQKEIEKSFKKEMERTQIGFGYDVPFKCYFDPIEIFPLKEALFEGYEFFIPNREDLYLEKLFGSDYMTPPPVDKRRAHSIKIIPNLKAN